MEETLERHRWPATLVTALLIGAGTAVAVDLGGFSTPAGVVIGAIVAVSIVAFNALLWRLTGRPVEAEPLEEIRYDEREEAEAEATRRNRLEGPSGAFWIEVEHPEGGWGVELRGQRRRRPGPVADAGASGIWIDGGGVGGGGGDGG